MGGKSPICQKNEDDYIKIGDTYKIECELKAEVAGFLFGVLHIPRFHDADKGYPIAWINDSLTLSKTIDILVTIEE